MSIISAHTVGQVKELHEAVGFIAAWHQDADACMLTPEVDLRIGWPKFRQLRFDL